MLLIAFAVDNIFDSDTPKLFLEGESKGAIQRKGALDDTKDSYHGAGRTPMRYQQPVLFDFSRNEYEVVLSSE